MTAPQAVPRLVRSLKGDVRVSYSSAFSWQTHRSLIQGSDSTPWTLQFLVRGLCARDSISLIRGNRGNDVETTNEEFESDTSVKAKALEAPKGFDFILATYTGRRWPGSWSHVEGGPSPGTSSAQTTRESSLTCLQEGEAPSASCSPPCRTKRVTETQRDLGAA